MSPSRNADLKQKHTQKQLLVSLEKLGYWVDAKKTSNKRYLELVG